MNCKKCGFNNEAGISKCTQCGANLTSSNNFMKIIITLGIVIFIILSIPFVSSKLLESKINEHKISLKEKGIETTVDYSSGYFVINKKLTFKVNNGRYLAAHLSKILKEKYPDKKSTIDMFLYEKEFDWESLLNGMFFTADLKLNAYLLEDPTLDITLKELSQDVMDEIKADKEATKVLLPLLDKGVLSATILFNKQAEQKGIKFKDIDENISNMNTRLNFQLLSPSYLIDNYKEIYELSRFYFNFKENDNLFNIQINNINATNEAMDKLNSDYSLNIDELLLLINQDENIKFKTGKLLSKTITKEMAEKVSSTNEFSLNNIEFSIDKDKFELDKFLMNITLANIDKNSLLSIIDDYSKSNFNFDAYNQEEINHIFALLNKGMQLNFESNVNGFTMDKIKSSNLFLTINFKILENKLTMENLTDEFLKNIELSAQLKIDKKALEPFIENSDVLKKYLETAILKDDYYVYNLEIKNSEIKVNDVDYNQISQMIGDFYFGLEDYYKAINFYEQAVKSGNEFAKFKLAHSYSLIEENDMAIKLYKEFITKYDDAAAMNNLALIYFNNQDYKNSVEWAEKAITKNYSYDLFSLAYSYDMLKDYTNAKKYYEKSIEKDKEVVSLWNLGLIYEFGKGDVSKDEQKAFNLYLDAANQNYESAINKVSYMYRYGIGTKKDIKKADFWQSKNPDAQVEEADTRETIKKEFYDNGITIKIEYPESIVPDSIVSLKLTMTNELPYAKSNGGLSISFPQFSNIDIIDEDSTFEVKAYSSNSKLWNSTTKKNIISNYFMYEGWEKEWKQYETKTMNFSFYLKDTADLEDLNVLVRSVIINDKVEYVNPKDGVEGQQGYKNISINIPFDK